VGEAGDLLAHRLDDVWRGVADTGDCDAGAEVDEAVPVDVLDDGAGGPLDVGGERG
jgi:hypothetical protein